MNRYYFLLIVLHEAFATAEQVLLEKRSDCAPGSLRGTHVFTSFFSPLAWCAFLLTGLAWFIWFIVLAGVDLSVAMPFRSVQYLMVLAVCRLYLKERMDRRKVCGTLLIIAGIVFVAMS